MSTDGPQSSALGSPQTNSVSPSQPGEPSKSEIRPNVPAVEDRVAEFIAEYPQLAGLPLSEQDGRRLRGAVVDETREVRTVVTDEPHEWDRDAFRVEEVTEREAVTWADALRSFLSWFEGNRERYGRFGKGPRHDPDRDVFFVQLHNSWQLEYQKEEYAKLQALSRETTGGERPTGGETAAEYRDPYIVFLTRSSTTGSAGNHRPPVDHDRELAESWPRVYDALRNAFRRLGVESDDWVYHRQGEPHTGGGPATCYGHEHTMVVFDAAAADREPERADFEPVIDAHVKHTEGAGPEAHEYENTIELQPVGDEGVGDVAGYMGKYVSHAESDLLERDVEYLAWAANQWATNTQKAVRSDAANQAIRADRCRQAAEDPDRPQVRDHGAEVRRRERRRGGAVITEYVCVCCGSPWGIDQEGTLASKRLGPEQGARGGAETVVADGGAHEPGPVPGDGDEAYYLTCEPCGTLNCQHPEEHQTERVSVWGSVTSGAKAGEPPKRREKRRRIERYLETNPEASVAMVAGRLELPPADNELIREVMAGEDSSEIRSVHREPGWQLEAIVDRQVMECHDCRFVWERRDGSHCPECGGVEIGPHVNESPAPGSVDMRPLKLPGQREARRREAIEDAMGGVEQALYTCECGVTLGPELIVSHLESHRPAVPLEQLGGMADLSRRVRSSRSGTSLPKPPGD